MVAQPWVCADTLLLSFQERNPGNVSIGIKSSRRVSSLVQRLTGSMPMHPLPAVMSQGVHVALCSDDPAVFGNMGLTFDFYQVSLPLSQVYCRHSHDRRVGLRRERGEQPHNSSRTRVGQH